MPRIKALTRIRKSPVSKNKKRRVRGFMCRVAWDHELGKAISTNIHSSEKVFGRLHQFCAEDCGLVEVETRLIRVITGGKIYTKR